MGVGGGWGGGGVKAVVEMRGGGSGGYPPPPNVQRTLAFMLSRETLQKILDRKTPQMFYPISHTG